MSENPSPMTVYDGEVVDHGPPKILAFATSPFGRRTPWGPSATGSGRRKATGLDGTGFAWFRYTPGSRPPPRC